MPSGAPPAQALRSRLPSRGSVLRLGGLPGSSGAVLAAWLAAAESQRLLVVIAPAPGDAERWLTDLAPPHRCRRRAYPQREALGEDEPHYEIAGERAETIEALLGGRLRILVTTARATAERTLVPAALDALRLPARRRRAPAADRGWRMRSSRMGYRRVPTVTEVAEFSVRGGILDVYGFGMAAPARLEWWGDDISLHPGLRSHHAALAGRGWRRSPCCRSSTRRSAGKRRRVAGDAGPGDAARTLLELLPADTLIIEEATGPDADEVSRAWKEAEHHLEVARRLGEDVPSAGAPSSRSRTPGGPPRRVPPAAARGMSRRRSRSDSSRRSGWTGTSTGCGRSSPDRRPPSFSATTKASSSGWRSCSTRVRPAVGATLAIGALDGGFVMPTLRVLTDHEIFRRARRLRRPRRYRQAAPFRGDGRAHRGRLRGAPRPRHRDLPRHRRRSWWARATLEVAVVEYEGGDRLNVPLYRLDQLERYRAAGDDERPAAARLHRSGRRIVAAGPGKDPPGHPSDGGRPARPLRQAQRERRLRLPARRRAGSASSSRRSSTRTRPTSARRPTR